MSPSLDPSGISLIPNLDYNMFRDSGSGNVTGSVYYGMPAPTEHLDRSHPTTIIMMIIIIPIVVLI